MGGGSTLMKTVFLVMKFFIVKENKVEPTKCLIPTQNFNFVKYSLIPPYYPCLEISYFTLGMPIELNQTQLNST